MTGDNFWKVIGYCSDGSSVEYSLDTREAAHIMYQMLAADNQFSSFRCESPILTVVENNV